MGVIESVLITLAGAALLGVYSIVQAIYWYSQREESLGKLSRSSVAENRELLAHSLL